MITRKQAQDALRAFTWCGGEEFMLAYEKTYGHACRWDGYMNDQFDLMQRKPLDFIVKWDELAATIIMRYIDRNE
jgi:hypothetical protein